ncbi:MAG: tRNA (adenosine(37)-N6)-threonylcarbamoyltransferase complex transferase subunit TsaD [Alphaproteobacteria bacterium]|jgi:N6-L-threonylcarbamoyladenine synthase|nr:tRNA (adenosine(37)-N6)-threonylcarbamoyltransferase complex transferase subunit TsaD [Alphaproteobacteria bacterium]MBT5390095.1 tRNA (adenosine(37)-N6)-threonylcarbamoyltransferase complex transferase subunit TsaD [Alphaproteobacteria bacterium]MBT5540938.1 tRNA (adenosine(37)-N6)-threonylcarbamoyltransferase complex transferase subunit TsaD [Alphaproteobacteria bacterium]MBT5654518.1 tRNA (adenosine(37)-N6)-threonylcarbamoyltransferase complex transferase subunit TsaD [Alphaproteobacteria 
MKKMVKDNLSLGIESSCDETAVSVVGGDRAILSNYIQSQNSEHKPYGGVVPELGARAHLEAMDTLIQSALEQAGVTFQDLDLIAVTGGPGLIGGIIVGVMTAKAIAAFHRKPLVVVNHLEGHALAVRLTEEVEFPYLLLLMSGGHTQFLLVQKPNEYKCLGTTLDDAVGECFDKVAKIIGLGFPGGPAVEKAATKGDGTKFKFPRPLARRPGCDFSFSGLKTAVRFQVESMGDLTEKDSQDLAASFQTAVGDVLVERSRNAFQLAAEHMPRCGTFVVSGGVAANHYLRSRLEQAAQENSLRFCAPPVSLCTDNGAMIAWAGLERFKLGLIDGMDFAPRPRWPLEELSATCTS